MTIVSCIVMVLTLSPEGKELRSAQNLTGVVVNQPGSELLHVDFSKIMKKMNLDLDLNNTVKYIPDERCLYLNKGK